jgi:hypothetical protein
VQSLRNKQLYDFEFKKSTTAVIDHGKIPQKDMVTIAQVQALAQSKIQVGKALGTASDLVKYLLLVPYGQKFEYDKEKYCEGKVFA